MNNVRALELKVGVFSVLTLVMIVFSMVIVDLSEVRDKKTKLYYTMLTDAAGIKKGTQVKTNGITIGTVATVSLQENLVKIAMEIGGTVVLPSDSVINIRTRGLLGDVFVDVARGNDLSVFIPENGLIPRNAVSNDLTSLMNTLSGISRDIKKITTTLRSVLGSEESGNSLREIIQNLRELTQSIHAGFKHNEKSVHSIIENFADVTEGLNTLLQTNSGKVTGLITNLDTTIHSIRRSARAFETFSTPENADRVTAVVTKITDAANQVERLLNSINEGRGSIGQLITEDKTITSINNTLEDIQTFIKPMGDVEIKVDYRTEYLAASQTTRNRFGLQLQTSPDRAYIVDVIDDAVDSTQKIVKMTETAGVETTTTETIQDSENKLRFNFQFSKRYWNTGLRFGLFSSAGGVAVDQYLFDSTLRLSLEAYNFSSSTPLLRAYTEVLFFEHIVVNGGVHDILGSELSTSKPNFFGGLGLNFSDEHIKTLLSLGSIAK